MPVITKPVGHQVQIMPAAISLLYTNLTGPFLYAAALPALEACQIQHVLTGRQQLEGCTRGCLLLLLLLRYDLDFESLESLRKAVTRV